VLLGLCQSIEEALVYPITQLSKAVALHKRKERHRAQIPATNNWLLYQVNRGEKAKSLDLEDFLPWQEQRVKGSYIRGLLTTAEMIQIERLLDSDLVTSVAETCLRLELGLI
jgi:hypothetical protein